MPEEVDTQNIRAPDRFDVGITLTVRIRAANVRDTAWYSANPFIHHCMQ
ncbi:hypothetical protein [Cupriavidus sp. YAF13]